jgi:uncharacterized protein (TIGR00251 family)
MSLPDFLSVTGSGVVIEAIVHPRANRDALVGPHGSALKLKVTAPAIEDRANRAVEALLAGIVGVPKADVSVVGGRSSRHKRIRISGVDASAVADALRKSGGVLSSRAHEPGEEVNEENDP